MRRMTTVVLTRREIARLMEPHGQSPWSLSLRPRGGIPSEPTVGMSRAKSREGRGASRGIDWPTAIHVVRHACRALARGEALMPPKLYLPLPHDSDFRAMPALLRHPAACGVKWVNVHPHNPPRGLPSVMALIVMSDPPTGMPLAVMDGLLITKVRTAAAAAVAAEALARPESASVGLVGCGAQADAQIEALAELFRLRQVKVWGHAAGEAKRFCAVMRRRLPRMAWEPCATIRACVRAVDLLVTITPSRRPLVKRKWLAPGVHINAIGADGPGKQEFDAGTLRAATVVVDDRAQAIHGGELNVPVRRRQYDPAAIHATLGEVLIGRRRGRGSQTEITVFDSTGLAIHDIALGHEVLRRALRRGLGRRVSFLS